MARAKISYLLGPKVAALSNYSPISLPIIQAGDVRSGDKLTEFGKVFEVKRVYREGNEVVVLGPVGTVLRLDSTDNVRVMRKGAGAGRDLQRELLNLRPQLAAAAQKVYDEWEQDEDGFDPELGGGGICDEISNAMAGVVLQHLGEVFPDIETSEGGQDGDDHAWLVVIAGGKAYGVDIPPSVYERGGGYSWTKIPGVTIRPGDVQVFRRSL